jgi:hypothetical protein
LPIFLMWFCRSYPQNVVFIHRLAPPQAAHFDIKDLIHA